MAVLTAFLSLEFKLIRHLSASWIISSFNLLSYMYHQYVWHLALAVHEIRILLKLNSIEKPSWLLKVCHQHRQYGNKKNLTKSHVYELIVTLKVMYTYCNINFYKVLMKPLHIWWTGSHFMLVTFPLIKLYKHYWVVNI